MQSLATSPYHNAIIGYFPISQCDHWLLPHITMQSLATSPYHNAIIGYFPISQCNHWLLPHITMQSLATSPYHNAIIGYFPISQCNHWLLPHITMQSLATSPYHNAIIGYFPISQCNHWLLPHITTQSNHYNIMMVSIQFSYIRPLAILRLEQCVHVLFNSCSIVHPAKIIIRLNIYIYMFCFSLAYFSLSHTPSLTTQSHAFITSTYLYLQAT